MLRTVQGTLQTRWVRVPLRLARSRQLWRWFLRLMLLWLVLALLLGSAIILYGQADRAENADVIVVLGAGLSRNNRPGPALIRRTEQAAALYARGLAGTVICTGGYGYGRTRSEADACAELLLARGVPSSAIVLEDQSRSTEENALYTREIMDANGWITAVVVSDSYHLLRAAWIFNQAGIASTTSPAASAPPPFQHLSAIAREVAAFHWLVVKGVLNLPVTYVPII